MSLIVILGPTAVGKTKLAVALAAKINGEVISADSRQVYQGMDIGTGKDLKEYEVNGAKIPYHLIDIKVAGEEYNLFDFQSDFYQAYEKIISNKGKTAILCGGTGMYLEAALDKKAMLKVPVDKSLRKQLENENQEELNDRLAKLNAKTHNTTDLIDRERTIRAIEIETFKQKNIDESKNSPVSNSIIFGVTEEREVLRERIDVRLKDRLEEGLVEEVKALMDSGISAEKLNYYGLEYRFVAQYLSEEIGKEEMYVGLLQAIRKFAKRQMTWYRRMEKRGHEIRWINASEPIEAKVEAIIKRIAK